MPLYREIDTHSLIAPQSLLPFDRKESYCFRVSLCTFARNSFGLLPRSALTSSRPLCWKLLHDQTTFNRSVLVKNGSAQRRRHTTQSALSFTCLQHMDFLPPLHCYLKREVKLMIIHLPQTDLSKRQRAVILIHSLTMGVTEYVVLGIFP